MTGKTWAYYLHTNGDIIGKHPMFYGDIEGNFVVRKWLIDTSERADAWRLILQALASGCDLKRAKELVDKWGLTYEDSKHMLIALKNEIGPELKKGLCIFIEKFLNMTEDEYFDKIELEGKPKEPTK